MPLENRWPSAHQTTWALLPRSYISAYVSRVRIKGTFVAIGFVAIAGASGACALVSGLSGFTNADSADSSAPPGPSEDVSAPTQDSAKPVPETSTDLESSSDGSQTTEEIGDAGPTEEAAETDAVSDAPADLADAPVDGGPPALDAGPVVDAGDGASAGDDGGDGGCQPVTHNNGFGQTFVDCVALNTHDETQAHKACLALEAGACAVRTVNCVSGAPQMLECENTLGQCACWAYTGTYTGSANKDSLSNLCACPTASLSPAWN